MWRGWALQSSRTWASASLLRHLKQRNRAYVGSWWREWGQGRLRWSFVVSSGVTSSLPPLRARAHAQRKFEPQESSLSTLTNAPTPHSTTQAHQTSTMSSSVAKVPKVKKSKKSKGTSSGGAKASTSAVASPFTHLTTTMRMAVPPYFSGSQGGGLRGGVEELLDSMVMR